MPFEFLRIVEIASTLPALDTSTATAITATMAPPTEGQLPAMSAAATDFRSGASLGELHASLPVNKQAEAENRSAVDESVAQRSTEGSTPDSPSEALGDHEPSEDIEKVTHIPGINYKIDYDFYNALFSVDPKSLTEAERAYTDEYLESLTVSKIRELTPKMAYDFWEGKKKDRKVRREGVPISGSKAVVLGKVLAYFQFMREENATDGSRVINNNPTFTPEEDARLIEIMTDPNVFPDIRFAFQSGSRSDIDSVDGSLVETTWNAIIAGRYFNNFSEFQPPNRHTDPNDVHYPFDPNKSSICRRTGATLKNRFAQIRSKCTVLNSAWSASGDNDPDRFQGFAKLNKPLDRSAYYMWLRIREGGELVSRRLLRTVPVGNDSRTSTRDNATLMRIMQGHAKDDEDVLEVSDSANNSNNGGAIGMVAKNDKKKKRKKDDGEDGLSKLSSTLEAIADNKGRREARRAQLIATIDSLDGKMNTLLDELDPEGKGLLKRGLYISRRRKMYREARKQRWICHRELEALQAGHDDPSKLPPEEEPSTDMEEAEFLHDQVGSDDE